MQQECSPLHIGLPVEERDYSVYSLCKELMHWGFCGRAFIHTDGHPVALSQITRFLHSACALNRMPFSHKTFTAGKNNHESGAAMTEMTQTSPLIWEQLLTDHGGQLWAREKTVRLHLWCASQNIMLCIVIQDQYWLYKRCYTLNYNLFDTVA